MLRKAKLRDKDTTVAANPTTDLQVTDITHTRMRSPWGRYRPITTGYIARTQHF